MSRKRKLPENFRGQRRIKTSAIWDWASCWDRSRLEPLLDEFGATTTASAVLRKFHGRIPAEDLLWLLLRDDWYREPAALLRWHACNSADRALALVTPDERSVAAVQVSRDFAVGRASPARLAAAWAAARAAAWAAAGAAAWAAAGAAAWAAARAAAGAEDAAWAAARAASRAGDAAEGAAWDAAWAEDAAWDAAVLDLADLLHAKLPGLVRLEDA